jgi:hypothetical protein
MPLTFTGENIPTFNFVEKSTKDDVTRREILKENSTRAALVEATVISHGTGQVRLKSPVTFTTLFRSEPHFTFGSGVIVNPDAKNWNDPVGSAGVYRWAVDDNNFFVGAYVWVRVDVDAINESVSGINPPAGIKTQHYLTFSGMGIKNIKVTVQSDAKPRKPGI